MLGKRLIGVAVLALCLLAPAASWGAEEEEDPFASFTVKASNGYRILVLAGAEQDEPGEVIVYLLHRSRERAAYYKTQARVTSTSLEADLGTLGRIDLQLFKTGRERERRTRCAGSADIEQATYYGTFEFHGEEGFADASASRIRYNPMWFYNLLLCGKNVDMDAADPGEPRTGALLRALTRRGKRLALVVEAAKNRPEGRTLVRAALKERRDGIAIQRGVEMFIRPSALNYRAKLGTATLRPPAPFSGSARFRRDAGAAGRWTGNLRVDLPGRANVSLARPDLRSSLARGNWDVSRNSLERPSLARPLALLEP